MVKNSHFSQSEKRVSFATCVEVFILSSLAVCDRSQSEVTLLGGAGINVAPERRRRFLGGRSGQV